MITKISVKLTGHFCVDKTYSITIVIALHTNNIVKIWSFLFDEIKMSEAKPLKCPNPITQNGNLGAFFYLFVYLFPITISYMASVLSTFNSTVSLDL